MPLGAGTLHHYQNATHTADIDYEETVYAEGNPFWDSDEGQVNFRTYCERNGFDRVDFEGGYYLCYHHRDQDEQARARVHRPGQERPVSYYHLIAEHSMDQTVQRALDRKEAVVDSVIAALGRPRPERSRP